ncbi:MAG: hypothetical protein AAGJ29_05945 [Pseudomonadota bacterium]
MVPVLPYSSQLVLSGPETVGFLDRTVTCEVSSLSDGAPRPGALLTPQGKVISDFLLSIDEAGIVHLAVHSQAVDALEKRLKLMRLRADVQIDRGPDLDLVPDEATRIAAGRPAFGQDFLDTAVFPTDINLDVHGGVAYRKGCFVGQEVVSRMKRRGTIRKRTVVFQGAGVARGQTIQAGDVRLGDITSANEDMALALVRIDHLKKALAAGADLVSEKGPVELLASDWLLAELEGLAS